MGHMLAANSGVKFTFCKQQPEAKHYFIFRSSGIRRDEGRFSLTLRHWNLIKAYGVSAKESKLNAHAIRHYPQPTIIEVSPKKIGSIDYAELRQDRRKLYFAEAMYQCALLALSGIALLLFIKVTPIRVISAVGLFLVLFHAILSVIFFVIDRNDVVDALSRD